jgi:hypothetical protein
LDILNLQQKQQQSAPSLIIFVQSGKSPRISKQYPFPLFSHSQESLLEIVAVVFFCHRNCEIGNADVLIVDDDDDDDDM